MTAQSWEEIPHATMTYEADATELLEEVEEEFDLEPFLEALA